QGRSFSEYALKGCCEKITLWVFAGHWLRAPRTRGWTDQGQATTTSGGESPAHAGMDRPVLQGPFLPSGEPRARGDGPDRRYRGCAAHHRRNHHQCLVVHTPPGWAWGVCCFGVLLSVLPVGVRPLRWCRADPRTAPACHTTHL